MYSIILFGMSKIILITTIVGAIPLILYSKLGTQYEDFDKKRTYMVRRMNYFKNMSMGGGYTKEIKLFGNMPFIPRDISITTENGAKPSRSTQANTLAKACLSTR